MLLHNQSCEEKSPPTLLPKEELSNLLKEIPLWVINDIRKEISRDFIFNNYHQTLEFINAVAIIIHKENHHPNINFGYNHCNIHFSTHSVSGITIYDFICAAKIEQLFLENKEFKL